MRRPLLLTLFLAALSAAIFLGLRQGGEVDLVRAAPDSALALLMVNEPSKPLAFPGQVSLPEWLPGDPAKLLEKIPPQIRGQISALLEDDLERALLIVHRLEKRQSGAWKIHFTALLQPKPRRGLIVEKRIEAAMALAFGSSMRTVESDSLRVYQGEKPEQTLHQVRLPGLLMFSNTARGRDESLASWIGKTPRMADRPGFQRVRLRLPLERGIFFYCDCRKILPLLPEFGYQIEWVAGRAREETFVVR